MPAPDLIRLFALPFQRAGIDCMIVGSVAAMYYGIPRLTLDIDFAAILPKADLLRLPTLFPEPDYYCPPVEILQIESRRPTHGHFNLIHIPQNLKADIYLSADHPMQHWAMARCRPLEIAGETIQIAPPEYIIIHKLGFWKEGGSEKHLHDIRGMLEVSGPHIDQRIITTRAAAYGLTDYWQRCLTQPT